MKAQLRSLPRVRAVVFDVYGTMLISNSGDVGTAVERAQPQAMDAALVASGLEIQIAPREAVDCLLHAIHRHHERLTAAGIEYPEVDIVEVWADLLGGPGGISPDTVNFCPEDLERLAVEYEMRVNPVWPMPFLQECLASLHEAGLLLGIISNAQFFTQDLFSALMDESLDQLGFDAQLRFYSYQAREAKPGLTLYQRARETFQTLQISADEVLYVGNDMLNDIMPAERLGFRTALFAGDARSLRCRENDPRVEGVTPDLVITHLSQLEDCLNLKKTNTIDECQA